MSFGSRLDKIKITAHSKLAREDITAIIDMIKSSVVSITAINAGLKLNKKGTSDGVVQLNTIPVVYGDDRKYLNDFSKTIAPLLVKLNKFSVELSEPSVIKRRQEKLENDKIEKRLNDLASYMEELTSFANSDELSKYPVDVKKIIENTPRSNTSIVEYVKLIKRIIRKTQAKKKEFKNFDMSDL